MPPPPPKINVELSILCKTGVCIKTTKRCIKKTFSYFSTFQRWPPPQLHMAGHNNRATKTIKKQFTSPWQLSLLAQKTRQKCTKNCLELFRAPSYLGLSFLKDVKNSYFCAVHAHCASGTLLQIFCSTTSEKSCKNDEKHHETIGNRSGHVGGC